MKYLGAAEEFVRIWIEYGQEAAADAIDAVEARYGHETATALLLSILQILDDTDTTKDPVVKQ